MTAWTAKRFWTTARVEPCDGGFAVRLDARMVKTPAKRALTLPTVAMAQAVAAEWQEQTGVIRPESMPFTRAANSAIDKISPQFAEVAALISEYGGSDLLCYRATEPQSLILRQARNWDPLLDWAASALQAPLMPTHGVMPRAQPAPSIARLRALVLAQSPFQLAGLHDLVAISGSLVLAFAVTHQRLDAEQAWALSRIDENWQREQWGADEDALATEARRRADFLAADRFYQLCR